MRSFLHQLRKSLSRLWERDLFQRRVKIGVALAIPFLLIVAISLFSGSRDATQAAARLSPVVDLPQDAADLPFDFQFIGQGQITGGTDDVWMIGNVPIRVDDNAKLIGDLHVGDFVILSGRILQDQSWLADRIQSTQDEQTYFTFNSPLERIQGSVWQIGGHSLTINQRTEMGENLQVNQILLTTFTALEDGTWVALKIVAFEKFPEQPVVVTTETLAPTPTVDEPKNVAPVIKTQSGARGNEGGQTKIDKGDRGKGKDNGNGGKGKGNGNRGKGKGNGNTGKGKDK